MRFKNAFTPCPICVPARATMITGKYPHKCTGRKENHGELPRDMLKLPELLASKDYCTYSSGKLHYLPYAAPDQPRTLHGFQHAKLAESGRIIAQYDKSGQTSGLEDYFDYLGSVSWKGYTRAHGVGNNDIHPAPSPLPGEHTVDAWVATEAIHYLDQHLNEAADRPFFLKASFPKPHAPFDPPRPYDSIYDPREIPAPLSKKDTLPRTPHMSIESAKHGWDYISPEGRQVIKSHYYGLITFQDEQVGRVIEHLKAKDLYDNTLILFVGDHGEMLGDFGYYFKSCMYEGSVRIPMMISGPGIVQGVSDALVGLEDLLPTLAELVSTPIPDTVDGKSLVPILTGEPTEVREAYVAYCLESPRQTYMVRTKTHKYIYNELGATEELYDLVSDPNETKNRVTETGYQNIRQSLRKQLIDWAKKYGDSQILHNEGLATSPIPEDKVEFDASVLGWRHY